MVLVSYKLNNKYRTIQTTRCKFLGLQSSDDSSTLVGVTSFAGEESRMTTVECITALFYEVDEQMGAIPKHPEARLWPSEVVTLGLLHVLKGVGNRAFYRWLTRDYRALFPPTPRTHPTLSPLPDPSGLDTGLLGHPDRARRHRHGWDRAHPPHTRRPESPPDRPQGALQSPLDGRGQTLSAAQSVGVHCGVGLCDRP